MEDINTPKSSPSTQPRQPDQPPRPEDVERFENVPLTKKIYLPTKTPIYSAPSGTECARYNKPALFHILKSPSDTPKGWHRIGTSQGKEIGWVKNAIQNDPESDTHAWPTRLTIRMHTEKDKTNTKNFCVDDSETCDVWSNENKPIHFPVNELKASRSSERTYGKVGKPLQGKFTILKKVNGEQIRPSDTSPPKYPFQLQPNIKGSEGEPVNELGYLVPRGALEGAARIVEEMGEKMETMLKMNEWNKTNDLREKLDSLARIEFLLVTGDMPPRGTDSDKTAKLIDHLKPMLNPHPIQVLPVLLTEGPEAVATKATESKTNFEVYMRYFQAQQKKMADALQQEVAESMYEDGHEQTLTFIRPNELP